MRIIRAIGLLALSIIGSTSFAATCTNLGNMGPPDIALIGNSFSQAGTYTDCYTFDLSSPAASFGGALDVNYLGNKLDINVASVALLGSGGSVIGIDTTPLFFSFGALAGGVTYTLAIVSDVVAGNGLYSAPVSYGGYFATYASPAPEPAGIAMLLLGLAGVYGAVRRRKR